MLDQLGRHSRIGLTIEAEGDLEIRHRVAECGHDLDGPRDPTRKAWDRRLMDDDVGRHEVPLGVDVEQAEVAERPVPEVVADVPGDLPADHPGVITVGATDDAGRYVVPDLPRGNYSVWVRGYGLADSTPVTGRPGQQLNLQAVAAPTPMHRLPCIAFRFESPAAPRSTGTAMAPMMAELAGKVEAHGGAELDRIFQAQRRDQPGPRLGLGRRRRGLCFEVDRGAAGEVGEVLPEGVEVHVPARAGDSFEVLAPGVAGEAAPNSHHCDRNARQHHRAVRLQDVMHVDEK